LNIYINNTPDDKVLKKINIEKITLHVINKINQDEIVLFVVPVIIAIIIVIFGIING